MWRAKSGFLHVMKGLGFDNSILHLKGTDVEFKMSVDENAYLDQLSTVLNILEFNDWLSIEVVSQDDIQRRELEVGPIKTVTCAYILRYSKHSELFNVGNSELTDTYIKMLENKVIFPDPPDWLI